MSENGWHETKVRVRYKDTDRMGVVYYGNFLTFFEMARSDTMRDLGYSYAKLEGSGYILPVTEAIVKYHGNVGYDALLTVRAKIAELRKVRLRFDYEVLDDEDRILVEGHTVHACMSKHMKPSRIPKEVRDLIKEKFAV